LPEGAALDLCAFRPTFVEDFNSLSASGNPEDHQRWFTHTPWGGDFGDAAFTDPQPGFPFTLRDGILRIEARKGAAWAASSARTHCRRSPVGGGGPAEWWRRDARSDHLCPITKRTLSPRNSHSTRIAS
jgi:hypothetical protein